jgi:hypothetical protein
MQLIKQVPTLLSLAIFELMNAVNAWYILIHIYMMAAGNPCKNKKLDHYRAYIASMQNDTQISYGGFSVSMQK